MGTRIEEKLKGRVCVVKDKDFEGRCYLMRKTLGGMRTGPIGNYIIKHLNSWLRGSLLNVDELPSNITKHVYFRPEEAIFVDTETLGLAYSNPIFLIGYGYVKEQDVVIDLLLARTPLEEEAMLRFFNKFSSNFKQMISYNGLRFDNRRLVVRNRSYQIDWEWPDRNHLDLYKFIHPFIAHHLGNGNKNGDKKKRKTSKLGDVEKILFGLEREEDLPSAEVPKAYEEYILGGSPDNLVKAIKHNDVDVVSLVATYLRILIDPKFKQRILEYKNRKNRNIKISSKSDQTEDLQ
ncbi:ribonuclease H-like domain-containing protein [Candidatus Woesearchaeota archaeon]|nr:ribonuclease H-like domain-containing protein [Candidatus Woesearchaeota archaeon]